MYNWAKLGRVFDPTAISDRPWLQEFAQAPATLIFDDFVRVYFSCRPPADESGQYVSYSSFVDLDRSDLTNILRVAEKPVLSLGAVGSFDQFGTYPISVLPSGKDFIAYYAGWTRCESVPFNTAIGMAISSDGGVTFERVGQGPILPYTHDEPFVMSGPKIRYFNGRYTLFYIAGSDWIMDQGRAEPVYKIRMAFSDDGINWNKVGKNLVTDVLGEHEAQASPDVIYASGAYHMFFCYRHGTGYRGKERGYRIGYAVSENLLDWTRKDDCAGLDVSEEGWDSEMVSYPHVFELDGQTYMMYLGDQVGRFGFGLARLEGSL